LRQPGFEKLKYFFNENSRTFSMAKAPGKWSIFMGIVVLKEKSFLGDTSVFLGLIPAFCKRYVD
jgi:hypothetical protein